MEQQLIRSLKPLTLSPGSLVIDSLSEPTQNELEDIDVDNYFNGIISDLIFEDAPLNLNLNDIDDSGDARSVKKRSHSVAENELKNSDENVACDTLVPPELVENYSVIALYQTINNFLKKCSVGFLSSEIERSFHPECEFIISCPVASVSRKGLNMAALAIKTGGRSLYNLKTKITRSDIIHLNSNTVKIVTHTRISGTKSIDQTDFRLFFGFNEDTFASDYMVDPEKTSPKEKARFRAIEEHSRATSRNIDIFVKVITIDEYDLTYQCVRRHWARVRLSSLRLARLKNK